MRHQHDIETTCRQRRAVVFFGGEARLKWQKPLKPGFKHCFAAISSDDRWIVYNPLSHQTCLFAPRDLSINEIIKWHESKGWKAISCAIQDAKARQAPLRPYTCVEAVKRVLGIQNRWIVTPWQLYRYLCRQNAINP